MILIVGSTGILGSRVGEELLKKGQAVRALVRSKDSERARALAAAGASLTVGDLKNRASLVAALAGVDTVVCTASATLSRADGDVIETVDRDGVGALIDAAQVDGPGGAPRRFVYVSFSGNITNDFPLAAAKRGNERTLAASKLDWVVLQPSYFAEVWTSAGVGFDVASGSVRLYGDGNARASMILVEDVVAGTVNATLDRTLTRRAIPMGGPRALSQHELVALVEKASGKKLGVEHMSLEQIRATGAAAPDSMTKTFFGLFEGVALGDVIDPAWGKTLGVVPQSVEAWIAKTFAR